MTMTMPWPVPVGEPYYRMTIYGPDRWTPVAVHLFAVGESFEWNRTNSPNITTGRFVIEYIDPTRKDPDGYA